MEVGVEQLFMTELTIEKVRHLREIRIPLSEHRIKHLILTGKNGSGKTSVAEALSGHLNNVFIDYSMQNQTKRSFDFNLPVEDGLDNVPYDGIVEGYFGADKLSNTLIRG